MKVRLRRLWLAAHRWLGLTVGLLFVLIGLTGSVLVFDHALDERLNPELLRSDGSGPPSSLGEVLAAAEEGYDGPATHAEAVSSPRVPNGVWTAWFQSGTAEAPRWTRVYVDPYTARVTGQRDWGEDLMGIVYRLHYTLVAGEVGETIIGLTGLVLMLSVCSGLYLWWPLWKNGWRAAFAIRQGRLNYDLHKTTGFAAAAFLLVLAFTGVYMIFPEWVKPAVTLFSSETLPPQDLKSAPTDADRPLTPEDALAIAKSHFPDAKFDHFHPPQGNDGTYEIGLRQPDEVQKTFGRTQVWIDQYSGQVLAVRDPNELTFADHFIAWQFPLHSGEAFGMPGRLAVFFTGLTPAALYVTGFALWWRRRKSQRRQQSAAKQRSASAPQCVSQPPCRTADDDRSGRRKERPIKELVP